MLGALAACFSIVEILHADNISSIDHLVEPLVIKGLISHWPALDAWSTPERFAAKFGSHQINANRTSFAYGLDHVSVDSYAKHAPREHIIVMDDTKVTAREYKFLQSVQRDFDIPRMFKDVTYSRVLSWGGGERGVRFMKHCVAWIGMIAGRKLWQFAHPSETGIDTDCDRPTQDSRVRSCIVEAGDVVYVPDMWWHATCNLDPHTIAVGTQCDSTHLKTHANRWTYKEEL